MKRNDSLHKMLLCMSFILLATCCFNMSWGAEFYRWVDKDGVMHISDRPPDKTLVKENDLKVLKIYNESSELPAVHTPQRTVNAEGQYVVPFRKQNGGMLVDVLINDYINARMLFDTGASITSINVDLLKRLNQSLPAKPVKGKAATAGGQVEVNGIILEKIDLGGAVKEKVWAAYSDEKYDFANYDGLLGMSFLSDFKFTIDYENNTITLHRR